MLSAEALDVIDQILRNARCFDSPFGGVRVILCGDVLQLPPIVGNSELSYFFQSEVFAKSNFYIYYLSQNYRQRNQDWIEILNKMRTASINEEGIIKLNEILGKQVTKNMISHGHQKLAELCDEELKKSKKKIIHKIYNYPSKRIFGDPNKCKDNALSKVFSERKQMSDKWMEKFPDSSPDSCPSIKHCLYICYENVEVECLQSNSYSYSMLNSESQKFQSIDKKDGCVLKDSSSLDTKSTMKRILELKEGQLIVFCRNNIDRWVANNSLGKIISFNKKKDDKVQSITVLPLCPDRSKTRPPIEITRMEDIFNHGKYTFSREQFPIYPADACTLHLVQGMSIYDIFSVFSNLRLFKDCPGAVYVALSRHSDPSMIAPLFPITLSDIFCNPTALSFDRYCNIKCSKKGYFPINIDVNCDWKELLQGAI